MAIQANGLETDNRAYQALYNNYLKSAEQQYAKDVANMDARKSRDLTASNTQYDNTARQNYINYMQTKKNLPSQLNALGIRGGASESSALRLGTTYGANVANNEAARNSALDAIRNQYEQERYNYDKTYNENLAQKRAAYEQQQVEKDLEQFASAIKGQYDSKKGYEKLIAQLQKSNDPNKVAKIMLTRQAMNEWVANNEKKSGGGGGGGSRRRSYGGGGGGGYSNTSVTSEPSDLSKRMQEYRKKNYTSNATNRGTTTKKKKSNNQRVLIAGEWG